MKWALPLVLGLAGGVAGALVTRWLEPEPAPARGAPAPELYKDAGNVEKARALWNEGLRLFPDNEELKGTIEASTKR
jgi:hypothetical protein